MTKWQLIGAGVGSMCIQRVLALEFQQRKQSYVTDLNGDMSLSCTAISLVCCRWRQ